MTSSNGLKISSFNTKYDGLDYKCCIKDSCSSKCDLDKIPDSLVAVMLAVNLLPTGADIYNIQNVRSKGVVEHLLKEIRRVRECVSRLKDSNIVANGYDNATMFDIACCLNSFCGLCEDGLRVKCALQRCGVCNLNYVDVSKTSVSGAVDADFLAMYATIMQYRHVHEYNAYYNDSCLTLIKKSLCISIPETHNIPSVDSLVLFFEYAGKRLINVNVNLEGRGKEEKTIATDFDDLGSKRAKVESIVCFLKKYENCGAVILSGAIGDIDYDAPQLLFTSDSILPEIAMDLLPEQIDNKPFPAIPVASDFPCDLDHPIYEILEFLLKNCHVESISYAWLLQYLRLKGCRKCCVYKAITKDSSRCKSECGSWGLSEIIEDCKKSSRSRNNKEQLSFGRGRKGDICVSREDNERNENREERKSCVLPACVPKNQHDSCCGVSCKKVCVDKCRLPIKKCECEEEKCKIKCVRESKDCGCDRNPKLVKVDTCKNLCKKSCCEPQKCCPSGKCNSEVCNNIGYDCDKVKLCDPLTILKNDLHMYNVINQFDNQVYTSFVNHYNKCLDCKYPKGVFQAQAMCGEYQKPKHSRHVHNNSELMAIEHILVSDCLKNSVVCAQLTDLCIEKCGNPIQTLWANNGCLPTTCDPGNSYDDLSRQAYSTETNPVGGHGSQYVFEYAGSKITSFFTERVYSVTIDFPVRRECVKRCEATPEKLGLEDFWCSLCDYDSDAVDISVFQDLQIDKHDYFRDFFWDVIGNKVCPKRFNSLNAGCQTLWVQKNAGISKDQFIDLLMCQYNNATDKDTFVVTIGFMTWFKRIYELTYRKIFGEGEVLFSGQTIADVFPYDGILEIIQELALGIDNVNPADGSVTAELMIFDTFLRENCNVYETLIRHAARKLSIKLCDPVIWAQIEAIMAAQNGVTTPTEDTLIAAIQACLTPLLTVAPNASFPSPPYPVGSPVQLVTDEELTEIVTKLLNGEDPVQIVKDLLAKDITATGGLVILFNLISQFDIIGCIAGVGGIVV